MDGPCPKASKTLTRWQCFLMKYAQTEGKKAKLKYVSHIAYSMQKGNLPS